VPSISLPRSKRFTRPYAQSVQAVRQWQQAYARRLAATDAALMAVVIVAAYIARYGLSDTDITVPTGQGSSLVVDYRAVAVILALAWLVSLWALGTRERQIIGVGSTEYSRVGTATLYVYGLLAILALVLKLQPGRAFVLMTFLGGLILLPFGRWLWRQWLVRQRRQGACVHHVLLLGAEATCLHTATQIGRDPTSVYRIVGAMVDDPSNGDLLPGVPLLAGDPLAVADAVGADTIIYTGSDSYGPDQLRELGWKIEARRMGLIVAPGLTDIAGPRLSAHTVAGLPLVSVDYPTLKSGAHLAKRSGDLISSVGLLIVLSPLLLLIAVAVRLSSPGPVIFRQERVGLNGKYFRMLKFRTMVANAEDLLPSLLDQSEGNDILFKLRQDPRITPVGRFLRRYSLDELPQLVNVLFNDMSLVGPRPPLAREVRQYDEQARRRLLVKPGITGLWQVSGRSDLSWEDSIRLDLYYVENWTLAGDLVILYRTVRAVIRSHGAY
jgi:exopolysaccharide biosynthesis polyprenyl glycosylphosphotransferase